MSKELSHTKVMAKKRLSKNMMRITLEGEGLVRFPDGFEGGYVKLMIPRHQGDPVPRSFTIRSFDPVNKKLTLDMVSHGDKSPAAQWMNRVSVGDRVSIKGPGACKRLNLKADWFLLAGDMTALPAISVNLELLPENARGFAVLEIMSEEDRIQLNAPKGMQLIWVVNPTPTKMSSSLSDTVMALPWLESQVSIWVAGEFNTSRVLRQHLRHERRVDRNFMYISCYWKIGDTNEELKAAKKKDSEAW
jgi:NADPH-dependent ferric siderophore reductase